MSAEHLGPFLPGQTIRITDGRFVGLKGRIIGMNDVIRRKLPITDAVQRGEAHWAITMIFGREVPVVLDLHQMIPD